MAEEHLDNHGKSVASWTAVGILLTAAALIAIGVYFGLDILTWIGVVLVVVGAIAGKALTAAGFGSDPHPAPQARVSHAEPQSNH
ncbi:HGxxPAAW family protein [Yimella sp. cx-51]|uniref:HGxxPAAW family protein n=1 Tax=Yimella sp. cx-51 TaxID=2770551 RepID=UPI00165E4DE6|nr:HGxxPAAW family protein [Yimella sp. cx-51]MBC9957479.1 hypothetical protein [Yimella sp. cx-51]QTH39288.1 hypothetical protein J5M86_06735 [Yimella sp. cx-51]